MKPINVVIASSFIWLLVSFWNRNELPRNIEPVPQLAGEPEQLRTDRNPFVATWQQTEYTVEPEFDYDLRGMIVSFRHHDGDSRMHLLAGDHLNMLDVCVVWGDNAANPLIHKLDFWNGIFTCNVKTRDMEAWDSFDMYQLSNNHLISDDEFIRRQVRKVNVGDQIRVRGYLASYGTAAGSHRGTSTTRLDTGDGACETLYVEKFEIIRETTSGWRTSMYASFAVFLFASVTHFRRPYRPFPKSEISS